MLCIESHSGGRMENICVIPVSACGGIGAKKRQKEGNNPVCDMAS